MTGGSAARVGTCFMAGRQNTSQFQSRIDKKAQDNDDRFIFRTTDNTLWFDANGKQQGGLTMLARLESDATLTFHDIFIF
jgi:hypothetical protein